MKLCLFAVLFFAASIGFSSDREFRSAQIDFKLSYFSVEAGRSVFVVKKAEVRFSNDGFCAFFTEQGEIPCTVEPFDGSDWWPIIEISKFDFVNLLAVLVQNHPLKNRALEIIGANTYNTFSLGQFRDITPDRFYEGPFPDKFTDLKSTREVVDLGVSSSGLKRL